MGTSTPPDRQPATTRRPPTGMRGFIIVWIGQMISLFGSLMTSFALTIWAWKTTGQATSLALMTFAYVAPNILLGPIAGVMVDRWSRKAVMILSDFGAALSSVLVLVLYTTGNLQLWHLYLVQAFAGTSQAFQFPAYSAAITMVVPKEHYARADGMISASQSASDILSPLTAGILLPFIGIPGVLIVDIITFVIAVGATLMIHIPQPAATDAGQEARGSFRQEAMYGFRYIFGRASLLGLQLVFFVANLIAGFGFSLLAPRVLASSGGSEIVLGSVQAVAGLGGLVGGLLLTAWGGPKRRIHGILVGMLLASLTGSLLMGLGATPVIWSVAAFCSYFFLPVINASNQAIWQLKVPPDVQGRVFSARRVIAQVAQPMILLIAGPLADRVFEPAMMPGGDLASAFGGLVGTGPGSGMALMFVIAGIGGSLVGLGGYAVRAVRDVEDILPDYEAKPAEA